MMKRTGSGGGRKQENARHIGAIPDKANPAGSRAPSSLSIRRDSPIPKELYPGIAGRAAMHSHSPQLLSLDNRAPISVLHHRWTCSKHNEPQFNPHHHPPHLPTPAPAPRPLPHLPSRLASLAGPRNLHLTEINVTSQTTMTRMTMSLPSCPWLTMILQQPSVTTRRVPLARPLEAKETSARRVIRAPAR